MDSLDSVGRNFARGHNHNRSGFRGVPAPQSRRLVRSHSAPRCKRKFETAGQRCARNDDRHSRDLPQAAPRCSSRHQSFGKKETAHAEASRLKARNLDPFNRAASVSGLAIAHRHPHLIQTRRQRQSLTPGDEALRFRKYCLSGNLQPLFETGETAAIVQRHAQNINGGFLLSFGPGKTSVSVSICMVILSSGALSSVFRYPADSETGKSRCG